AATTEAFPPTISAQSSFLQPASWANAATFASPRDLDSGEYISPFSANLIQPIPPAPKRRVISVHSSRFFLEYFAPPVILIDLTCPAASSAVRYGVKSVPSRLCDRSTSSIPNLVSGLSVPNRFIASA